LLARVGLRHNQIVDVDTQLGCVMRIKRVLRVDERGRTAVPLRLGDHMKGHRGFTGRLRAEHFDHTSARDAADPKRQIQRQGAGRDAGDLHVDLLAELHDRTLAELLLYLPERRVQCPHPVGRETLAILLDLRLFPVCFVCLSHGVPPNAI